MLWCPRHFVWRGPQRFSLIELGGASEEYLPALCAREHGNQWGPAEDVETCWDSLRFFWCPGAQTYHQEPEEEFLPGAYTTTGLAVDPFVQQLYSKLKVRKTILTISAYTVTTCHQPKRSKSAWTVTFGCLLPFSPVMTQASHSSAAHRVRPGKTRHEGWGPRCNAEMVWKISSGWYRSHRNCIEHHYMAMDQYLLIPFLVGWTSIYQLFWCSPGG